MRYYCHHCHTQIPANELLPDFTCPSCQSGFVEEMPDIADLATAGSRRNSSVDGRSQQAHSDDGLTGLVSHRLSSDEYSDDNDDVEFLDAVNGPLAQVFGLFQPQAATLATRTQSQQHGSTNPNNPSTAEQTQGSNATATSSSQSDGTTTTHTNSSNNSRIATRSTTRLDPGQMQPAYSTANQSLADVLNEFLTGVSFGTQFPEGIASNSQGPSGVQQPANRGLINIDFPLPFFLHSNPGDYAWGNAGFDAVITQLLNNLDGSNSGPPPMPKEQVENLPTVKISDEQVKNTNLQCTVCMDDFQIGDIARQLPCEHFFHQDCILPWLNLHASCPICRKTFVSGTSATPNLSTPSDPLGATNISTVDTQPNPTSPNSSSTNPNTTTPASRSTNPTAATVTNQNVAPRYDYTEDDCD